MCFKKAEICGIILLNAGGAAMKADYTNLEIYSAKKQGLKQPFYQGGGIYVIIQRTYKEF